MPGCAPETQRKIRTAGFVISILISVGFFAAVFIIQNQRKNEVLTDEDRINRANLNFVDDTQDVTCQCGKIIQDTNNRAQNQAKAGGKKISQGPNTSPIEHRIFGGTVAQVNSIPWQVGIKVFNTFPFCGGTIIGPTTILTAAHCVEASGLKPKDVKILVSEHDVRTDQETFSYEMSVRKIIMHPQYSSTKLVNDFAILRTRDVIPFTKSANAACLPEFTAMTVTDNKNMMVSGWGKQAKSLQTKEYFDTQVLKTANVKAYSNEDCCKQRFSPSDCSSNREVVDDSIICAGSTNQPVGICFGDSGGPLLYNNGSHNILVGVSSFVVGSCGTIGVTDGFARVTHQIDWIRKYSDNYVSSCSARIRPELICTPQGKSNNTITQKVMAKANEECIAGRFQCKPGYVKDTNGICQDECDLLKWSNSCSKGLFRATQGGWSKTITMTSGGFDISDWCFCHVKPYDKSNSYFKVIYNKFEIDANDDSIKWYNFYKKMESREKSMDIYVPTRVYSYVLQAQWYSSDFRLFFQGWNITIEAHFD